MDETDFHTVKDGLTLIEVWMKQMTTISPKGSNGAKTINKEQAGVKFDLDLSDSEVENEDVLSKCDLEITEGLGLMEIWTLNMAKIKRKTNKFKAFSQN